jgi:hypothetical protein
MAIPYPDGEGLQVVPQGNAQGLHGRLLNDAPEVYHEDSMQVYHDDGSNGGMKEMYGAAPYDSAPPARKRSVILGLSVPVFWTVVAVIVVVIIGVGVGAGVGVSSQNHSTSSRFVVCLLCLITRANSCLVIHNRAPHLRV